MNRRKVFKVVGGKLVTGTAEPIVAAPVEPPQPKKPKGPARLPPLDREGLLAKIQRLTERRDAMPKGKPRDNLSHKISRTRRKLRELQKA